MDNTCPEFAKIDETSDYGSNDSSHSSSQEEGFSGFCSVPDSHGKSFIPYSFLPIFLGEMRYFFNKGRAVYLKKGSSLGKLIFSSELQLF